MNNKPLLIGLKRGEKHQKTTNRLTNNDLVNCLFSLKSHYEALEELAINLISFVNYLPNPEGKAKGHKMLKGDSG